MAKNLAEEIDTEFLTCKICLESFTEPKSLNCLHTFCMKCLEGHLEGIRTFKYGNFTEFNCPVCRKPTTLPTGGIRRLPDNFLVSSLTEMVRRQRITNLPFCEICKLVHKKVNDAKSKCVDCSKMLCPSCVDQHKKMPVTKNHSMYDIESEKEIECKTHSEEIVRFYCEPCETCICVLCTFEEHAQHEIISFKEGVTKHKGTISSMVENCRGKVEGLKKCLEAVRSCEKVIGGVENEIKEVSQQFVSTIRAQEKQLVKQLHEMFGDEVTDFLGNKSEMRETLDNLQSTVNLAELVVNSKEIEFLLLKKQLNEKLTAMCEFQVKQPPKHARKEPIFCQGSVSLGFIEDPSRRVVRFRLPEDAPKKEHLDDEEDDIGSSEGGSDYSEDSQEIYQDAQGRAEMTDASTSTDGTGKEDKQNQVTDGQPLTLNKETSCDIPLTRTKAPRAEAVSQTDVTVFGDKQGLSERDMRLHQKEVQTDLSLCQRRRKSDGSQNTPPSTPSQKVPPHQAVIHQATAH